MVLMNIFAGQQWRRRDKEQTSGHRWVVGVGGRRGWGERRECHGNIGTTIRKIDSQWECAV